VKAEDGINVAAQSRINVFIDHGRKSGVLLKLDKNQYIKHSFSASTLDLFMQTTVKINTEYCYDTLKIITGYFTS
jgi:hypothetical protein